MVRGSGGFFQGRIEDFDFALGAEVAEPFVEEDIHLLLKQNFLNARGDFFERRDVFTFGVQRKQGVVVVGIDLLLGDAHALAKAELDEAENLETRMERGLDELGGEAVSGKEGLPAGVGGTVGVNAGGQLGADFLEAGVEFRLGRNGGLEVFLTHLLLDESAADELLESVLGSEGSGALPSRVKNGEANLFVDIAQQNGVIVDDGYDAVESLGGGVLGIRVWGLGSEVWGLGVSGDGREGEGDACDGRKRGRREGRGAFGEEETEMGEW